MRHMVVFCVVMLLVFQPARAGQEDLTSSEVNPYIALLVDGHTIYCINGTGPFTFYCVVLPSYFYGITCVSFSISLSSENIEVIDVEFDPHWTIMSGGEVPGDIEACYDDCLWYDDYEWTVLFQATVVVSTTTEEMILIGNSHILDCEQIEHPASCFNLYINSDEVGCAISATESTWGAIKDLYE